MKLPLLLCVCFSLISLPAWADKPNKQHPQQSERQYQDQDKFQKRKDRPEARDGQRGDETKVYRSKKLRIHKNGQGRYGMPYPPSWQQNDE